MTNRINPEVERLRARTRLIQGELKKDRERMKPSPNKKMIEGIPDVIGSYNFWCDECQIDFESPAFKTIHRLHGDAVVNFRAYCPDCEEECVRHLTHRDHDPYYYLSDRMHEQRGLYTKDTLHHDQYGFRSMYGEPFPDHIKRIQRMEEQVIEKEREAGHKGLSLKAKERLVRIRDDKFNQY